MSGTSLHSRKAHSQTAARRWNLARPANRPSGSHRRHRQSHSSPAAAAAPAVASVCALQPTCRPSDAALMATSLDRCTCRLNAENVRVHVLNGVVAMCLQHGQSIPKRKEQESLRQHLHVLRTAGGRRAEVLVEAPLGPSQPDWPAQHIKRARACAAPGACLLDVGIARLPCPGAVLRLGWSMFKEQVSCQIA